MSALILLAAPALALRQDQSDRNGHGVRTGPSHCAARNGTVGLTKRVASTYPRRPDSEDHVPIPLRKQWHQAARCLPDTDVLGSMRFSRCAVLGGARREKPQPVRRYDLVMRVGPYSHTHSHLGALMNVQWLSDAILGYEGGRRLQARAARGLSAPVQSRARLRAAGSAIRRRRPRVTRRPPRSALQRLRHGQRARLFGAAPVEQLRVGGSKAATARLHQRRFTLVVHQVGPGL